MLCCALSRFVQVTVSPAVMNSTSGRNAKPDIRLTLVESVGKKARFLEDVCALLGLTDIEIRNERAEALGRERRDRYDVGTARAVGTLGQVGEYIFPFLRLGGDAIVWKGRV